MNSSLQATGLPGYRVSVWQGMGANGNTNQFDDINQITNIAKGKSAKSDPGPAIGKMILKYLPGYEADSELGYDPQDFVDAKQVANIYITKGERAGLQAQIQLDSHVSDMIDELLSDSGGYRLRTISSDDLDEGYDTDYADQRYKDHEAAMAAKEWEREHNRIKQQHPGGIHGVASGVDAERWLIPYRMLLKNNFKPTETDDRFEYLMQVALKLKGANAGFSSTTGMSNAAEVFGLQPEEQTLVAKLIRSAPHVSEIEKYMRDNTVSEAEDVAEGDEDGSADDNIIMQLRKASDYEKPTTLVLGDNTRITINKGTADKMLAKFNMLKPESKALMQDTLNTREGFHEMLNYFNEREIHENAKSRAKSLITSVFGKIK